MGIPPISLCFSCGNRIRYVSVWLLLMKKAARVPVLRNVLLRTLHYFRYVEL